MAPNGRLLSSTLGGATFAQSSTSGTQVATNAGDLCMNPIEGQGCTYSSTNQAITSWLDVTFPGGLPAQIGSIYFMNRVTTGCGTGTAACEFRVVGGNLTLHAPAGNFVRLDPPMTQAAISTYPVNPYTAPVFPDPTAPFQTNETNRRVRPRYVRIRAAGFQCLHFREIMVSAVGRRGCTCGSSLLAVRSRLTPDLSDLPAPRVRRSSTRRSPTWR